jgi:hypothetical protein
MGGVQGFGRLCIINYKDPASPIIVQNLNSIIC